MNRSLLVVIFSVLAVIGAYVVWEYNHPPALKPWDLVPEEAIAAYTYHRNSPADPTRQLLTGFLNDSLQKELLKVNYLLISAHIISKEEMSLVLYLMGTPAISHKILGALKAGPSYHERNFTGYTILEGTLNQHALSAVMLDDILVISQTPVLIEDVIRLAHAKEKQNFISRHHSLFQLVKSRPDSTSMYADLSRMQRLTNLFVHDLKEHPLLNSFGQSLVVEGKWEMDNLLLSGFATDSLHNKKSVLSLFNRQRPVQISLQQAISSKVGYLVHFGITDFKVWNEDRLGMSQSWVKDSLSGLASHYHFNADGFYKTLDTELGVCEAGALSGQVLVAKVKDVPAAEELLRKLDKRKGPDLQPVEAYAHYEIHSVAVSSIATTLFWPLTQSKMNFYAVADRYLIFSEKIADLKTFLGDFDAESTWGKSSEWNDFLSSTQETNVGLIFDGANWWPSLQGRLTPRWKERLDSLAWYQVSKGSVQFSRLEHNYYFNGILKWNSKSRRRPQMEKEKVLEVALDKAVTSGLSTVRNHTNGQEEVIVQDESNALRLFSSGLKSLFSTGINGRIKTGIYQIDFYRNRKLQYLFATDRSLCLIDRLGNTVRGFPKNVSADLIQYLTVVDYDHSLNYRFLITDRKGGLHLLDRDGKPLPDWRKCEVKEELVSAPQVARSRGRDYILAVTSDGRVFGFNRKGEGLDGFPVNLKIRPAGQWIVETTEEQGTLTAVGSDGLVVQMDLASLKVTSFNLARSSATSRFALAATHEGNHYVFSRLDKGKIAVLNDKGEVIFEKDNPGSEELLLSYFESGTGKKYFGFTDPQQEFTYLFAGDGTELFTRPLESHGPPVMLSDKSGDVSIFCYSQSRIRNYHPARPR